MTRYQVSVIIPSYNKADVLPETLGVLAHQTLPLSAFEVILVDDGSQDGTVEAAEAAYHPLALRVVHQPNRGAGAARNLGASRATGNVLVFLDADIVAAPELLEAHARAHASCDRVLVAGRVQPYARSERMTAYDVFGDSFDLGDHPRELGCGAILTQSLSIKSHHFGTLGGFDESLRRGQDVEFGYRACAAGFDLMYDPHAQAYHNHALAFGDLCEKTRRDHADLICLFRDRPQMLPVLGYLADEWPVDWANDAPGLMLRKVGRRALALGPVRGAMRCGCQVLERAWPEPGLLRFLVWKTLAGYQLAGLREGMARYGWQP